MKKALFNTHARLAGAFLLLISIAFSNTASAQHILNNGKLRFGTGSEQSINATGNLQQPFYYNPVANAFYKLTFSNYPLDNAYGAGGVGTSEWNTAGSIVSNPVMSGQTINSTGFVATSGNSGYGTIISTGNVTVNGQMVQVENTYSLGQTSGYIQVKTRLKNVSATSLTNVRYWIGTRDDWVGNTDVPRKQRGNLVNNAFVQNAGTAARALALKVTTGNEGVLFYTAHPTATVIVHPNYGDFYNRIVLTNPATSSVDITSDGSYGMYVRMNDLAVNASDEFTWYYAAGDVASFDDIINQVATVSGAVQNITYTSAQLNATSSVSSTGYWMVVPQGSAAPTAAQIQAGVNYGTVVTAASGSGPMTANVSQAFAMTGLTPATSYQVYFVSQDASAAFSAITAVPFTTQAYTAPVVSTTTASSIAQTTAMSGGNVTADGGQPVSARGVCWNQTGSPTLANNFTNNGSGLGSFQSNLSGLTAGTTYYVRAYATNSVGTTYGNVVSFTTCPASPLITANGPTTFCQGGSVTLTATPGASYSWSNNATTQSITVTASGSYSVTVTSASGCVAQSAAPVAVTVNALPASTTTTAQPLCFGSNDGTVAVTVSGTAPFTYSKNGGAAFQSAPIFSGLTPGSYSVLAKDANGCTSTPQSVVITEPAALTFSATKADASCFGTNSGSITVTATGGSGSNQYSIDGGANYQSGNVFGNLTAGTYSVRVKDQNNCTTPAQNVTIDEPTVLTAGATATNVVCAGDQTGTVTVTAAGGTAPYLYSWSPSNGTATTEFSLGVGTYTATVTDAHNCTATASATVEQVDNVLPVVVTKPVTIYLDANGQATVAATQVNDGSTDNCAIPATGYALSKTTFGCADAGNNTVILTVTDVNGNSATANATVTVIDNTKPTITAPANVTMNGYCTPITVTLGTPVTSDNCQTTTTASVNNIGINPATYIFPVGVTTVKWTVADASGNTEEALQTVTINPATVTSTAAVAPLYPFPGQEIQTIYLGYSNSAQSETISVTPTGGTGPYTYSWTRTDCNSTNLSSSFTNSTSASSYTFSPTAASICKSDSDNVYSFTVIATDSRGCAAAPVTKRINVVDPYVGNKIRLCHVPPGNLTAPNVIYVSVNALQAHLDHGDFLGNCIQFQGRKAKPADNNEAVKVYPNPNTGSFRVELSQVAETADIVITDLHGKVVARQTLTADGTHVASFNLGSYSAGMYMVHVQNGDQSFRTKVVIQ